MRVLLISTYELGRQPFGLASPAAWLRARGHEVSMADLAIDPLPGSSVDHAECVAFYLPMHTATRLAAPVIAKVRERNPRAKLAAYGLYAPLNADYLHSLGVGTVIGGEFEQALVQTVEGSSPGSFIPLDKLTFLAPDRDGLPPLERYARMHVGGEQRVTGYTEASRGCKHLCRHCPVVPVYQGKFRVVPVEIVVADVDRQVAAGARHITFGDPDFFNGPSHARQLVERLHARHPRVTFDVTIKIEHLRKHRDLLPLLKDSGCLWITSAVESVEPQVLEALQKHHTREDFLEALALVRHAGLQMAPTFVPFTPWTTLDGYLDLLGTLRDHDLVDAVPPVQLALRLLIPEGSLVLELEDVRAALRGFDRSGLLHRWKHPDARVDELARAVFDLVAREQKAGTPRRVVFEQIWRLAHDGAPPENFDLLPRAAIPYLDEPWYC